MKNVLLEGLPVDKTHSILLGEWTVNFVYVWDGLQEGAGGTLMVEVWRLLDFVWDFFSGW